MINFKKLTFGILTFLLTFSSFAEIIFETDFSDDGDFYVGQQQAQWSKISANKPSGFDGALVEGAGGYIKGVPGAGVGGSVALKMMWDPGMSQPTTQLFKHLTGDENTGYDEVYIRYKLRLPDNFMVGTPDYDPLPYWKFGRLWQNTGVAPGYKWTALRPDAFQTMWSFGGSVKWGADAGGTFGANSGERISKGLNASERYSNGYFIGRRDYSTVPGYFRHVGNGAWDFHSDTRMLKKRNQAWHTIEWRFKLSSSNTSGDGVFQIWFDGVEQIPVVIEPSSGAPIYDPPLLASSLPTARHGSGYNFLVMFDNMAEWNGRWGDDDVEGGIYVNDLVISSKRIGHTYSVGDVLPNRQK